MFPPQSFRPLSITNGGITSTSVYNAQNLPPRRALFPIPVSCGALPRIGDADEEVSRTDFFRQRFYEFLCDKGIPFGEYNRRHVEGRMNPRVVVVPHGAIDFRH